VSDKRYTDFDQVRAEIERQTELVAGSNKGIVNDPIVLTMYAPDAPDLSLVDLPGITRVPVKGSDHPEDIERLTREMTLHYIQDPRTIILAVLPANQDMSVSDALQLAKKVDPKGIRSIGVLTKIDIMDEGTDAGKMLRGEEVPLKYGYVGVKMRSQADIVHRKLVSDALGEEKAWFDNHRVYSKLPPGLVGTPVLIDKLTRILFKSMRRFLPQIKKEINEKRISMQDRLDELGVGVPVEEAERVQMLWTLITDYCEMLKNTIRGKYDRKLQRYMVHVPNLGPHPVSGGSQVRGILNDFLSEYLEVAITADMSDEDIDRVICMHEGDSLPGFPSPDTFEFLASPHLQKLSIPSVECVHQISSALDLLAQRLARAVFRRFPAMAESVLGITQNIILRETDATRTIVEQQVACHVGYLFTNDPSYLIEHGSMAPMWSHQSPPSPPEEEKTEPGITEATVQTVKTRSRALYQGAQRMLHRSGNAKRNQRYSGPFITTIRKRLDAYFAITVRNVRDSVPKAIGFYLVRAVQDKLQFELLSALNQKDKLSALLGEPQHIGEERKTLTSQLQVLQSASAVLTRDPTLATIALEAEEDEQHTVPALAPPRARQANGASSAGNVLGSSMGSAVEAAQASAETAGTGTRPNSTSSVALGTSPLGSRPAAPASSQPLFSGTTQGKAANGGIFDETPSQMAKLAQVSDPLQLQRPSAPPRD